MLCARQLEKHLISIDTDYVPMWSDSLCNPSGNGAGATADIKHSKPRPQEFGKAAVVPLKGSSPEDSRIGPVRLGIHVHFTVEQHRLSRCRPCGAAPLAREAGEQRSMPNT